MFKGLHRFLPTLMKLEGAKIKEVKVSHRPRTKGKSKYNNFHRAIEGFFDVLAIRWMIKRHIDYKIGDKMYKTDVLVLTIWFCWPMLLFYAFFYPVDNLVKKQEKCYTDIFLVL